MCRSMGAACDCKRGDSSGFLNRLHQVIAVSGRFAQSIASDRCLHQMGTFHVEMTVARTLLCSANAGFEMSEVLLAV